MRRMPVVTEWVDENGNPLKPLEKGKHAKDKFDGYKFVETTVDADGNIKHIYKPVVTEWVDENGNPLKPLEKGKHAKDKFDGYVFVETTVDADGNIKHIYKKEEEVCPAPEDKILKTEWVDEEGNPLKDPVTGKILSDVGVIDGYVFIDAIVDTEGNIKYIFEKKNDCESRKPKFRNSIPKGFSPNGDGVNDLFEVRGLGDCFPDFRLRFYNRWGNLVYDSENGNRKGTKWWDGYSNGRWNVLGKENKVPVGTYFYILEFDKNRKGKDNTANGWVYVNYNK